MAIAFNCPHCQEPYKLPEKLAGKQAKCKNPECRKVITIPAPVTVPDDVPHQSEEEREAAALAALADEAPKQAEVAASEKVIPMTCDYCGHKWTEPYAKAGKNTLCPNPECRHRVKVPEPKEDTPQDWRQQKTKLPSLAKDAQPKPLEGVQSASEAKYASSKAIVEAGATGEEVEPRPLKQKIFIGFSVAALVLGVVFGVWYMMQSRDKGQKDQFMEEAKKKFEEAAGAMEPADAHLARAVLHAAEAEYNLREDNKESTKKAQDLFAKACDEVRKQPPGLGRHAVAAEFAAAVLQFGGTEEQARDEVRYRWEPDAGAARVARINQRQRTIHEELRQTLTLLHPAEFDFRVATARRLVRELAKRGQTGFAAENLPRFLFSGPELDEARAVVALEIQKAEPGSEHARKLATELKAGFAGGIKGKPYPVSAQTLFAVLGVPTDKPVVGPPPARGTVSEAAAVAFAGIHLQQKEDGPALELAKRGNSPAAQLEAFVLCAEWSGDPGPVLDAAAPLVAAHKGKKEVTLSQLHLFRLSQVAAASGRHDQSKAFADAIADEGLRAWARGDAARLRVAANPKEKADEAWVEVPDDPKKVKAGHAWGRLWVARQNARLSGDAAAEKKAVNAWPTAATPFGLAGIALGLKDR